MSPSSLRASTALQLQARLAALNSLLTLDSGVSLVQAANTDAREQHHGRVGAQGGFREGDRAEDSVPDPPAWSAVAAGGADYLKYSTDFGMRRQIFFCSLGGFDTHTTE